jgi:hypothetical protein
MKSYSTVSRVIAAGLLGVVLAGATDAIAQGRGKEAKPAANKPAPKPSSQKGSSVKDKSGKTVVISGGNVVTRVVPVPATKSTPPGHLKKELGLKSARDVAPGRLKQVSVSQGVLVTRDVLLSNGFQVIRVMPVPTGQVVYYRRGDNGTLERILVVPAGEQVAFRYAPTSLLSIILSRLGM